MNDDQFERWLQERGLPPPSATFQERIIARAHHIPQRSPATSAFDWYRLFADFALPCPACALLSMLFIGMLTGGMLSHYLPISSTTNSTILQVMLEEDAL